MSKASAWMLPGMAAGVPAYGDVVADGGAGAPAAVVNDQTGPVDAPEELRATICQKYRVPDASADSAYEALVTLAVTWDGGVPGPNRTSYVVAPAALHVSVGAAETPTAASDGDGVAGVPGTAGGGAAAGTAADGFATIVASLVRTPGGAVRYAAGLKTT